MSKQVEFIQAIAIPTNRNEALDAYAGLVGVKWGEEKAQFVRSTDRRSFGLLLNALAHSEVNDFGALRPELVTAAKAALTSADEDELRNFY